jgi:hypothetical protein
MTTHPPDFRALCAELHQTLEHIDRAYDAPIPAGLLEQVRAALNTPPLAPIPVSQRLPEPGIKVLAHYFNGCGKDRTVCATWIPAKFLADDEEMDDNDFLEYDEGSDKYYWPEGWYEEIDNWDELSSIRINQGVVDYWQPLPHWAIPLPEVEE